MFFTNIIKDTLIGFCADFVISGCRGSVAQYSKTFGFNIRSNGDFSYWIHLISNIALFLQVSQNFRKNLKFQHRPYNFFSELLNYYLKLVSLNYLISIVP